MLVHDADLDVPQFCLGDSLVAALESIQDVLGYLVVGLVVVRDLHHNRGITVLRRDARREKSAVVAFLLLQLPRVVGQSKSWWAPSSQESEKWLGPETVSWSSVCLCPSSLDAKRYAPGTSEALSQALRLLETVMEGRLSRPRT